MKITSRHMSTNGELILKVMLSGCKAFQDQNWSYSRDYDINECSVIIIDIDNAEGRQLWQTLDLSDSSLIKISYTATPENFPDNSYLLKKPIHFKELNRLTENLKVLDKQHSDKKSFTDIDPRIENKPSTVLETVLNNSKNKIIQLYTEKETIIIDSNRLLFSGSMSDKEVESLLISDFATCKIKMLGNNTDINNLSRDLSGPMSRAVSDSLNKKLLSALSYQDYFKLIRWPNFKKIRYNSAYVQIAVLLNNRFYDIASVSQICKVSFEDVITFINICYALHNLEIQTNGQPELLKKSYSAQKKQFVFLQKIRNRLGI